MTKYIPSININDFNYTLPNERIAKFPLEKRENSKLLIYKDKKIEEKNFFNLSEVVPSGALLVFNNTKVIRARMIMHKHTGARIEIFCLEPSLPSDYERAFSIKGKCQWHCIIGNAKKWKNENLTLRFNDNYTLTARRIGEKQVEFSWDSPQSFGELLELLGRMPIPPYLNRESEQLDNTRYQTVYSELEGSVAAPTAGLHFTDEIMSEMKQKGFSFNKVTLHVGAGTFLPVKAEDATEHTMHTEHFEVSLEIIQSLKKHLGNIVAVGTTSVRTLESLMTLANRIHKTQNPNTEQVIGQWEAYENDVDSLELLNSLEQYMLENSLTSLKAATQIMITPAYKFKLVNTIITNFHQPKSTLLLLISAFVGENWHSIYDYAMEHDFRFLSYGDSSILFRE
ncbi:MAG: S-adenosylmethionine:tRNA ribosyltransferase-isomerase [Rikenellaceae bacterium]